MIPLPPYGINNMALVVPPAHPAGRAVGRIARSVSLLGYTDQKNSHPRRVQGQVRAMARLVCS